MKTWRQKFVRLMKKSEPTRRLASFVAARFNRRAMVRHRWLWFGSVAGLFLVVVILLSVFSAVDNVSPVISDVIGELTEEAQLSRHPLTGERLVMPLEELPQVFGVMVENSADAWPLSGLDGAFLVIEAPVEGSIPRFIVFSTTDSDIERLGPVRSARPYYLDWNDELDAIYAHVGGSPEALELIRDEYDTIDLNQFWQSEYFWRQNGDRYAPHNVYTSSELLTETLDELELDVPEYEAWQFKEDNPVDAGAQSLKIDWASGSTYDVDWRYDSDTNTYLRYQGGSLMKMTDRATISANNVVVMATDVRVVDGEGRLHLVTVGEGDALIAQDGEVFLARWRKDERTERLRFYTHDGYEISMNAGTTWIEVVEELSQADPYDVE